MARRDPQRIITPENFSVAPSLLGIELARPRRRLFAIALDGLLIAILSNVGGRMLLAAGAAFMLYRASRRASAPSGDAAPPTSFDDAGVTAPNATPQERSLIRTGLRLAAALALFIFVLSAYQKVSNRLAKGVNDATGSTSVEIDGQKVKLGDLGVGVADFKDFRFISSFGEADDSAEAALYADSIADWVRTKPEASRAKLASGLLTALEDDENLPVLERSLRPFMPLDSATLAASTTGPDSATTVPDTMSAQIRALRGQVDRLAKQNARLREQEKDAETGFTLKKLLKSISDIAGFGLGWTAFYFTTFTMLMRGQTPGKALLGIRVIRLDAKPITGWIAFERFGGYAASAFTGLLGFAQIMWDRNRQALHDKVAETVVIREVNGAPVRPARAP